jgi:hypothetical protein
MADSPYVEVRCERCQSSFAPGTKRCVHCGSALGRRPLALDTWTGVSAGGAGPLESGPAPDAAPRLGRIVQLAMVALAVVAAVARACLERT